MEDQKSSWFMVLIGKLIAPAIVGLVVLMGQWVIQPRIAHNTARKAELLHTKQEAYFEAILLVNQLHRSFPWKDEHGNPRNKKIGPPIVSEKVYEILVKLYVVEGSQRVSDAFLQCFGVGKHTNIFSTTYLRDLIREIRFDLYGEKLSTEIGVIPYYLPIDEFPTADAGPSK